MAVFIPRVVSSRWGVHFGGSLCPSSHVASSESRLGPFLRAGRLFLLSFAGVHIESSPLIHCHSSFPPTFYISLFLLQSPLCSSPLVVTGGSPPSKGITGAAPFPDEILIVLLLSPAVSPGIPSVTTSPCDLHATSSSAAFPLVLWASVSSSSLIISSWHSLVPVHSVFLCCSPHWLLPVVVIPGR